MSGREQDFERMLSDILSEYDKMTAQMEKLRAEDKTKTVTYRELMGKRMIYKNIIDIYKSYGLV
ncbi:MAG: hypothetical protein ACI4Q6_03600 [Huintestinicola sp.]